MNLVDLSGKRILITGGSNGIGKATAILLSKLGAKVVLIGRNKEKLTNVLTELDGPDHSSYSYDLKQIDGIEPLTDQIVAEQGPFDGLFHSAGVSALRPLRMTNYNFLHDMMLVNFYSFVEIVRCLCHKGRYREGMSIVGMSSVSSIRGFKSKTAYCSSKAAMDGAIRAMAKELGDKKIRINSIVAGMIKTKMIEKFTDNSEIATISDQLNAYCLGLGEPNDVATAVAYLLSDCSRIITGTCITIDSGSST